MHLKSANTQLPPSDPYTPSGSESIVIKTKLLLYYFIIIQQNFLIIEKFLRKETVEEKTK